MAKVQRYIVGSRFQPSLDVSSAKELEEFAAATPGASIVKVTPNGHRVVEMSEEQMIEFASKNRHLIVEEDRPLELFGMPGLPPVVPFDGNFSLDVSVRDSGTGTGVADVALYAVGRGAAYRADTDSLGKATLQVNEPNLTRVIASPRDTYWSAVVNDVNVSDADGQLEIALDRLRVTGEFDWGHRLMGFNHVSGYWTGRDVSIGVIDSGMSDVLDDLTPAGGISTLDDQDESAWNVDEKGHGTHVGGIIAARHNDRGTSGGAPDAKIYSIKVFPGGFVSDIVEGVEWCIRNRIDVISMSLGSAAPSAILAAVLQNAHAFGITCVAAAGNQKTQVSYPAAFPSCIAVGALGRFGTFPGSSAHALKVGGAIDRWGQLFSAGFTNFGPEVEVCVPGVAVLSTVPTGYAAWDGTSMACPMVSALVALILEACPAVRLGNALQPEYVRAILRAGCIDLGMDRMIQGSGLPMAVRTLHAAQSFARTSWAAAMAYSQLRAS